MKLVLLLMSEASRGPVINEWKEKNSSWFMKLVLLLMSEASRGPVINESGRRRTRAGS